MNSDGFLTWEDLSCIDERMYTLQGQTESIESSLSCMSEVFVRTDYFTSVINDLVAQIHELKLRCGIIRPSIEDKVEYSATEIGVLSKLYTGE